MHFNGRTLFYEYQGLLFTTGRWSVPMLASTVIIKWKDLVIWLVDSTNDMHFVYILMLQLFIGAMVGGRAAF